jgi:hypothetical protein
MTLRSWPNCVAWLMFTGALILIAINHEVIGAPSNASMAFWLIALYGFQGFVAEIIGVRANETRLSFPRRIFPHLVFPVVWRKKISAKDIGRVDPLEGNAVRVYRYSNGAVDIALPDHNAKIKFIRFAQSAYTERSWLRNANEHRPRVISKRA